MRIIDLRLKDKENDAVEGVITSIKITELDGEKYIGVVLDTGYVIQVSLKEFDSITDYISQLEDSSENTVQENKGDARTDRLNIPIRIPNDKKDDIIVPKHVLLDEKCPICGSTMVWFSRDLGIKQCSNNMCKNSKVSLP